MEESEQLYEEALPDAEAVVRLCGVEVAQLDAGVVARPCEGEVLPDAEEAERAYEGVVAQLCAEVAERPGAEAVGPSSPEGVWDVASDPAEQGWTLRARPQGPKPRKTSEYSLV